MDCPKCNAFNSQLDTSCRKCGHSFAKKKKRTPSEESDETRKGSVVSAAANTQNSSKTTRDASTNGAKNAESKVVATNWQTPLRTKTMMWLSGVIAAVDLTTLLIHLPIHDQNEVPGAQLIVSALRESPLFVVSDSILSVVWFCFLIWWMSGVKTDLQKVFPQRHDLYFRRSIVRGFFIPFWNMIHIYKLMAFLYKESDPDSLPAVEVSVVNAAASYREPAAEVVQEQLTVSSIVLPVWITFSVLGVLLRLPNTAGSAEQMTFHRTIGYWALQQAVIATVTVLFAYLLTIICLRVTELTRRFESLAGKKVGPAALDIKPIADIFVTSALIGVGIYAGACAFAMRSESSLALGGFPVVPAVWLIALFVDRIMPRLAKGQFALHVKLAFVMGLACCFSLILRVHLGHVGEKSVNAQQLQAKLSQLESQLDSNAFYGDDDDLDESDTQFLNTLAEMDHTLDRIKYLAQSYPNSFTKAIQCMGEFNLGRAKAKLERLKSIREIRDIAVSVPTDKEAPTHAKNAYLAYQAALRNYLSLHEGEAPGLDSCMKSASVAAKQREAILSSPRSNISPRVKAELDQEIYVAGVQVEAFQLLIEHGEATKQVDNRVVFADKQNTQAWQRNARILRDTLLKSLKAQYELNASKNSAAVVSVFEKSPPLAARTTDVFGAAIERHTKLILPPQPYNFPALPAGVQRSTYQSALGPTTVFSTIPRKGAAAGPAFFWIAGTITPNHLSIIAELGKEGISVYLPTVRGEGTNAGSRELFYGELNDILAAFAAMKKLSHVDPSQIVVLGTGSGSTLALLLAEQSQEMTATVAVDPSFDLTHLANHFSGVDPIDLKIRSPAPFFPFLKSPSLIVTPSNDTPAHLIAMTQAKYAKAPIQDIECILLEKNTTNERDEVPECDIRPIIQAIKDRFRQSKPPIPTQVELDDISVAMGQ